MLVYDDVVVDCRNLRGGGRLGKRQSVRIDAFDFEYEVKLNGWLTACAFSLLVRRRT